MTSRSLLTLALCGATAIAACSDRQITQPRVGAHGPESADRAPSSDNAIVGGVFVASNELDANKIVSYTRRADGSLTLVGTFDAGGRGIGGFPNPLQSQGALVLADSNQRLYAVNAGSNSVGVLAVSHDGSLRLLGTVGSRGAVPVSVAVGSGRMFVVNQGDNTVAGYSLDENGLPHIIDRSVVTLGPPSDVPSTIQVSHDGKFVYVTQLFGQRIDVIAVSDDGELRVVERHVSNGLNPFGFVLTGRDQLIVSEATGVDGVFGTVSSYATNRDGRLSLVSASVPTHQLTACWVVLSRDEHFAYVTNPASGSISGYSLEADGTLRPLDADGRTGVSAPDAGPTDFAISRDGKFLYTLQAGTGTVGAFAVGIDGRLTTLPDTPGLTVLGSHEGLAAY